MGELGSLRVNLHKADGTQRAMALESVAERTHVHEVNTPAEARRRRGWWSMALRLCVTAGESPPADFTQYAGSPDPA